MTGGPTPALMLVSLAVVTGEFVIVGLLPGLASALRVSAPTAGRLIRVSALSVAFGSPFVAALLSAAGRRRAPVPRMAVFVAGEAARALAPDFRRPVAARVARWRVSPWIPPRAGVLKPLHEGWAAMSSWGSAPNPAKGRALGTPDLKGAGLGRRAQHACA